MFKFSDNRKTVNEIFTMFDEGKLIVDDTYQRRSVWSEKDKVRLIETILLQLVIPELFFWKADTDPETGISTTHIVDGQQRIKAIYSFIIMNLNLNRNTYWMKVLKKNTPTVFQRFRYGNKKNFLELSVNDNRN